MTITNRFARLFKADVHGILDCLEDPEAVLGQAIRDMREAIEQEKVKLQTLEDTVVAVQKVIASRAAKLSETERQVALCFAEGNEELAKHFVRKKLESASSIREIEQRKDAVEQEAVALKARIAEHTDELERICEKRELFAKQRETAAATHTNFEDSGSISEEAVEVAFLEEKRRFEDASA